MVLSTVKSGPSGKDGYAPVILHAGTQIDRPRVAQFSIAIVSFVWKFLILSSLVGAVSRVDSAIFEMWLGLGGSPRATAA